MASMDFISPPYVQSGAARLNGWKGTAVGGTAVGGTAVAGATVVVAGPQAARIMLVNTISDMSKNSDLFTISLLSKCGKTKGWVWGKKQK
jgi:hypothetical protein